MAGVPLTPLQAAAFCASVGLPPEAANTVIMAEAVTGNMGHVMAALRKLHNDLVADDVKSGLATALDMLQTADATGGRKGSDE